MKITDDIAINLANVIHNKGYFATQAALNSAYPTASAGDYAIVGTTDTVWTWDAGTTAWVDTDTKGQVTSVNGDIGVVTGLLQSDGITPLTANWNAGAFKITAQNLASGNLTLAEYIYHDGDLDTYIRFNPDRIDFYAGAIQFLVLYESGQDAVIWNENGVDIDFRIESGGGSPKANAFFLQGSDGYVGINEATPAHRLQIGAGTTAVEGFSFGTDAEIFRTAAGKMRMGTAGLTINNYLDFDFGQDWEFGTTVTGGGDASAIRFGSFVLIQSDQSIGIGSESNNLLKLDTNGGATKHVLTFQMGVSGDGNASGYFYIQPTGAGRVPTDSVANPTLVLYSGDDAEADDYIKFCHNQTNGVIDWGNGLLDLAGGNVSIKAGQLTVNQSGSAAAIPVLQLTQADVSEEFVRFIGTAASGVLTNSIVDDDDVNTATLVGWKKCYVQDDGNQITDQFYYEPIYTLV